LLGLLSFAGLLSGASATLDRSTPPIRSITFRGVPEDETLRSAALQVARSDFSRAQELLGGWIDHGARFRVVFRPLWKPNRGPSDGYAAGGVVSLNPDQLKGDTNRIGLVLRHEMTHLLQWYAKGAPLYWREGICDYVAVKLSGTDCRCTDRSPNYQAGYECAAAFLIYLEKNYSPDIVRALHGRLSRGGYSDEWFREQTGKELSVLWAEFQGTSSFAAEARERSELDEALKKLPLDQAIELFRAFLAKQPGGPALMEAADDLKDLAARGALPGFHHGVPARIVLEWPDLEAATTYPHVQTVRFLSPDGRYRYVYRVRKESRSAVPELTEAVRQDNRNGKITRRYAVAPR
jgi:hypothetical protein